MIRSILLWLVGAFLVITTFWNIWSFDRSSIKFPEQNPKLDVAAQEVRYEDARNRLLEAGYRNGFIGFITNSDLKARKNTDEDNERWVQAQFALLPWIVLRGMSSVPGPAVNATTPFVIGDFWDGPPVELPPDLVKLHESEDGLTLFRRTSLK
jgi:hypothetical protein